MEIVSSSIQLSREMCPSKQDLPEVPLVSITIHNVDLHNVCRESTYLLVMCTQTKQLYVCKRQCQLKK